MSNDFVDVLNLETGQRGRIRRNLFESPVFNPGILEEVDSTHKPYTPGFFKSRVAREEEAAPVKADLSFAETAPEPEKTKTPKQKDD